ncbi:MAG: helix-turn-helix domain-containing protein [Aristaeellaceae bacterium]
MEYSILPYSPSRVVTLCGENVYPQPELHPDRIMDEHDMMYIYSGEWTIVQDDTVYQVQAGDLIFLRAHSHHWSPTKCTLNARNMFIHMTCLPTDKCIVELSSTEAAAYCAGNSFCLPTLIHCGQDTPITHLFRIIIDTYWSQRKDAVRRLQYLLNLLLNDLTSQALTTQQAGNEWSVAIIRLFKEHAHRMYSIQEVAAITGMNERTLSSRFRAITGESIHQYQLNLKLEDAYRMLRDGGASVKEVAEHFGFCDAYYFSRMFKKKFGVSPKEIKSHDPRSNIFRVPADR